MNVKPQIGGVLGGGGEATQYFIVCENKPLFEVNSFKSGLFFCYIRISGLPTTSFYFGAARFKQKKLQISWHLCLTLNIVLQASTHIFVFKFFLM